MQGWLAACVAFAERSGLGAEAARVLLAFGGDEVLPAGHGDLESFESTVASQVSATASRTVRTLADEVDEAQAAMFGRRFEAAWSLLTRLADTRPAARLFRMGLACRVAEILDAPAPRALRVRAAIDYFYSRAARVAHANPRLPALADVIGSSLGWRTIAPGLSHAHLEGVFREGPANLNLLRVQHGRLLMMDTRRAPDLAALTREMGAPAAVSGGYFLYSEPDITPPSRRTDPVGLLVSDGEIRNPPTFNRTSLVQRHDRSVAITRVGPRGLVLGRHRIEAVNDTSSVGQRTVAFNRAHAPAIQPHDCPSFTVVGRRVVQRGHGLSAVPLAGLLVVAPPGSPLPEAQSTLACRLPVGEVRDAMAGGPALLGEGALSLKSEDFDGSAPPVTFSRDETFDHNLLPRMAAGLSAEGVLYFLAVDGRNFHRAPGLTLRDTARLLAALGCRRAMNLDGGSSKRMVVSGRVVDLASTEVVDAVSAEEHVRPVHSAIIIQPGA